MAANVAGAGKPAPPDPSPPKSGGGLKPATRSTGKSTDTDAAKGTASDKGTAAGSLNDIKKIGRYTILKKIGQGGMGTVFLAEDSQLKRQVALKVLAKDKAENPILVKRFKAEAQAVADVTDVPAETDVAPSSDDQGDATSTS